MSAAPPHFPRGRSGQQDNSASSNQSLTIFVGNISYRTTESDLQTFFQDQCGEIHRVRLLYDSNTNQSRGLAFVHFRTFESFQTALNLHRPQLEGRELRISPAKSNATSSSAAPSSAASIEPKSTTSTGQTRVVHCKKSPYDVYIGRPSDWGNPFVIGKDGDRADVIEKYRRWIMRQPDLLARAKKELRGQRIACWCKPEACHGDVLAEIADADGWFSHPVVSNIWSGVHCFPCTLPNKAIVARGSITQQDHSEMLDRLRAMKIAWMSFNLYRQMQLLETRFCQSDQLTWSNEMHEYREPGTSLGNSMHE